MAPVLDCGGRVLDLGRTAVMGILNVTPDSFSDGGLFRGRDAAVRHAEDMVRAGADVIDVGGESSRPGAEPVSLQQELDRVLPVVEVLAGALSVPVSIDTTKPEVMRAAVSAGAGLVNDISALRAPGALETAAELGVPVCLVHMRGEPRTMQQDPVYDDVVAEVAQFLGERRAACVAAGIDPQRLLVDPGIGFGKTAAHNLALLRGLERLAALGAPVLVGLSRKSFLGRIPGLPPGERVHASVALALFAVERGARIVRVHDVAPTVQALRAFAWAVGGGAGAPA